MGRIRGDVDAIGIANLLQMLSLSRCEGILTVSQNLNRKSIRFSPTGMRVVSAGGKGDHPLGQILVRGGRLDPTALDELLAEQKRSGVHLGVLLVRRGLLSKEDVEAALKEQISDEIYELFTWTRASFEWTGAPVTGLQDPSAPQDEPSLDSDVTSVMLEATRVADELSRIQQLIPDILMIPKRALEIPLSPEEGDAIRAVLPLVDGMRSVGRLIDDSNLGKFKVLGTLYHLVERGAIEIQSSQGETVVRRRPATLTARPALRGRKVLVLTEGPQSSRPLTALLRTGGLSVSEAQSSADIRETIERHGPGAIVLDVPVETDGGLAHCIRLRTVTPSPFLVMAGDTGPRAVTNAFRSGAWTVLVRPANESLLLERLSEMLQG